jgi:hypothetical protein
MRQSMRPAKTHEYALEAMETNLDLCADYTRSAVKMMLTVTLEHNEASWQSYGRSSRTKSMLAANTASKYLKDFRAEERKNAVAAVTRHSLETKTGNVHDFCLMSAESAELIQRA